MGDGHLSAGDPPAGAGPPLPAAGAGPPERIKAVPVRHWGRWLAATIIFLAVVWALWSLAGSKVVRYGKIGEFQFNDLILEGLWNTLWVSVASMVVGVVLGVLFGVMRLSRNPVLSAVSWFYIWFFRGTPVLVQLTFWYFAVPLVMQRLKIAIPFTDVVLVDVPMKDFMQPWTAALIGLGLNEGAYMAEIVRAGILSVEHGQVEAAAALGMTPTMTMRRIVLPQAMRVIIPPTGNEFISLLKTSSLASAIQFPELFRAAQDIYSVNQLYLELLLVISIWYLTLTSIFSVGQYFLERHYAQGSQRRLPDSFWIRLLRRLMPGRVAV